MLGKSVTGSCLCGAVAYEVSGPGKVFQYCHCSRCRKFTGSAHASNLIVAAEFFNWTRGEEKVGRFEHPEAKYFATCFCNVCGSSLPWANKTNTVVVITAGTLDVDPGVKPTQNIFWDSRAPWYEDVCNLEKFAELPVR